MNKAGALFDLDKLKFMNNIYLSRLSNVELFTQGKAWAEKYHPTLYRHMHAQPDYALAALSIERLTEKDPKRYSSYKDIADNILFFFDEERDSMQSIRQELKASSCKLQDSIVAAFVQEYERQLDLTMDVQAWFDQLKLIGKQFGFASNNQEFKDGGYIGKIGDLAMFLRIQLCCATRTPDLYSVMQVMGRERVIRRLKDES
jgi:glutamyl-tRNA synthetase